MSLPPKDTSTEGPSKGHSGVRSSPFGAHHDDDSLSLDSETSGRPYQCFREDARILASSTGISMQRALRDLAVLWDHQGRLIEDKSVQIRDRFPLCNGRRHYCGLGRECRGSYFGPTNTDASPTRHAGELYPGDGQSPGQASSDKGGVSIHTGRASTTSDHGGVRLDRRTWPEDPLTTVANVMAACENDQDKAGSQTRHSGNSNFADDEDDEQ